jgi:hypothetical protein
MQKFHTTIKDQIEHEFTVYVRGVYPQHNKWLASPATSERPALYYTGVVRHVIIDKSGETWIGMSRCSKRDTFNKKIGRAIARGRAEKAYHWFHSKDKNANECLQHVEITVGRAPVKYIKGMALYRNGRHSK